MMRKPFTAPFLKKERLYSAIKKRHIKVKAGIKNAGFYFLLHFIKIQNLVPNILLFQVISIDIFLALF